MALRSAYEERALRLGSRQAGAPIPGWSRQPRPWSLPRRHIPAPSPGGYPSARCARPDVPEDSGDRRALSVLAEPPLMPRSRRRDTAGRARRGRPRSCPSHCRLCGVQHRSGSAGAVRCDGCVPRSRNLASPLAHWRAGASALPRQAGAGRGGWPTSRLLRLPAACSLCHRPCGHLLRQQLCDRRDSPERSPVGSVGRQFASVPALLSALSHLLTRTLVSAHLAVSGGFPSSDGSILGSGASPGCWRQRRKSSQPSQACSLGFCILAGSSPGKSCRVWASPEFSVLGCFHEK